jgi:hypothetical protein
MTRHFTRHLALLGPVALLASCAGAPMPDSIIGQWGGNQASLLLAASGGPLSYPCGAGVIDSSWSITADGHFSGAGVHYFGGGAVPIGGWPPHPARYTGQVEGDVLVLTVTLTDLSENLGPFHLIRGGPDVQETCL